MVCRSLMLELHRAGRIELPPRRMSPPNPLGRDRKRPRHVEVDTTPIETVLPEVRPLRFQQVRRSGDEGLYNSLIDRYHYLGYTPGPRPYVTWATVTVSSAGLSRPAAAAFT